MPLLLSYRSGSVSWLAALRRYLVVIAIGNLGWEFGHLPLYTIWEIGTAREIVFAAAHCTGGDILIALSSVVAALVLLGTAAWPNDGFFRVGALAICFGVSYTAFSEWLNTEVRQAWAYSELMPVVWLGPIRIGLSPILQWLVVPTFALWFARNRDL